MIRDNQMLFNRLQVVIDAAIIVISYIAGYNLRFSPRWYDDYIKLQNATERRWKYDKH